MSKAASALMAGLTGQIPLRRDGDGNLLGRVAVGHDGDGNIVYDDVVYQDHPASTFVKRSWVPSWFFRLLAKSADNEQ